MTENDSSTPADLKTIGLTPFIYCSNPPSSTSAPASRLAMPCPKPPTCCFWSRPSLKTPPTTKNPTVMPGALISSRL